MNKRILRDCLRVARDYLPSHPQFAFYPHYSFIVQDNKVLGWATNSSEFPTGPLFYMYAARLKHNEYDGPKTHSEVAVFKKLKGIINKSKDWEIINIRLNRNLETKTSAPCSCCHQFLNSLGCSKVYFTTDVGWAKVIP